MALFMLHENVCATCKHWECNSRDNRHASYSGTMYVGNDLIPGRCKCSSSCKFETSCCEGNDCVFHESVDRPTEVGLFLEWDDEATERKQKEREQEEEENYKEKEQSTSTSYDLCSSCDYPSDDHSNECTPDYCSTNFNPSEMLERQDESLNKGFDYGALVCISFAIVALLSFVIFFLLTR